MRFKTMRKVLAALTVLSLIVAVTVPAKTFHRVLRSLSGAASDADAECQILVQLQYNGTSTFEYRAALSRDDASRTANTLVSGQHEYIIRAKQALAERQGYGTAVYGAENYKILSGVQVLSVKITDLSSGRTNDVWRSAQRGDPSDHSVMD